MTSTAVINDALTKHIQLYPEVHKKMLIGAIKRYDHNVFSSKLWAYYSNDFDVGMAAVQAHSYNLQYLAPSLQDNEQIVMEAIKVHGPSLDYASPRLQRNPEFKAIAVLNGAFRDD